MKFERLEDWLAKECVKASPTIPKWILPDEVMCEETEGWVREALSDFLRVIKQCAQLKELNPASAPKYDVQCADTLQQIARKLQGKLEEAALP